METTPHPLPEGASIAVVGAGIAGLASAWLLARRYRVTLLESGDYFGGHTNTVDVTLEGQTYPVDTGFLVHNELTYPNLIAMFQHLDVAVFPSDMSFGVSISDPDIEWAGTSLATVFAQKRNLLRPAYLVMLADIMRFNRAAPAYLQEASQRGWTLGELLAAHGYGKPMRDWYLLPMAAAIWSSSVQDILGFPAETFLRFCLNHRLLQVAGRPQWRTVLGGAREYVKKLLEGVQDARLASPVSKIQRDESGVSLTLPAGKERFDAVVLACHAPTSLAMLDADDAERQVLAGFSYQPNRALLHTDRRLLPRREKVWSAWNYLAAAGDAQSRPVAVSYLLNQLQPLPFKTPVVVTLNPHTEPAPESLIASFDYEHPVMNQAAVAAQARLPQIQGRRRTWFCGAWAGYGFHEDGLKSALRVARDLGVTPPWEAVYD
ncbi:FAD-dependent oxidoreductase [Chitinimonas viridis]|uniref:FAD-dependent oxidoreductase n=1 Tax=Chitinimonas viridis TaxID=664880 RepID=A0ABT8B5A2_9NEIS|nr:FAD-dependent oxidoreductase [Chitinimonas viridis]MDN3577311.1 FAD-dependent oxidoreductase [Chitinimonas viridis]